MSGYEATRETGPDSTLAQNLLEEARMKFERERQPGVVRHAQEFFSEITEGRYRGVYAPLGEQTITVTDADGRAKQPSRAEPRYAGAAVPFASIRANPRVRTEDENHFLSSLTRSSRTLTLPGRLGPPSRF